MKLLIAFFISFSSFASTIEVTDPWIREVPPVSKMSAGFVKLKNNTDKAVKLIEVKSDLSKSVEIHTHGMVGGVMKMRKIPHIEVPAKGEANLKPGGLHIMFINLIKKTIDGEKHNLEFIFDNGFKVSKEAIVK